MVAVITSTSFRENWDAWASKSPFIKIIALPSKYVLPPSQPWGQVNGKDLHAIIFKEQGYR